MTSQRVPRALPAWPTDRWAADTCWTRCASSVPSLLQLTITSGYVIHTGWLVPHQSNVRRRRSLQHPSFTSRSCHVFRLICATNLILIIMYGTQCRPTCSACGRMPSQLGIRLCRELTISSHVLSSDGQKCAYIYVRPIRVYTHQCDIEIIWRANVTPHHTRLTVQQQQQQHVVSLYSVSQKLRLHRFVTARPTWHCNFDKQFSCYRRKHQNSSRPVVTKQSGLETGWLPN